MLKELLLGLAVGGAVVLTNENGFNVDEVQKLLQINTTKSVEVTETKESEEDVDNLKDLIDTAEETAEYTKEEAKDDVEDTESKAKDKPKKKKKEDKKPTKEEKDIEEDTNEEDADESEEDVVEEQYSIMESFNPSEIEDVKLKGNKLTLIFFDGSKIKVNMKNNRKNQVLPREDDDFVQADTIIDFEETGEGFIFYLTNGDTVSVTIVNEDDTEEVESEEAEE